MEEGLKTNIQAAVKEGDGCDKKQQGQPEKIWKPEGAVGWV
jgi:hypothetical protein